MVSENKIVCVHWMDSIKHHCNVKHTSCINVLKTTKNCLCKPLSNNKYLFSSILENV